MNTASRKNRGQENLIHEGEGNRITGVVVYSTEAVVTRTIRAQAKEGNNRFQVEICATRVETGSVQAAVYGDGEILGVQYREIPVKDDPVETVKALADRKRELVRTRRDLEQEKMVLDKEVRFLDSVVLFSEEETPRKLRSRFPSAENLDALFRLLGDNYRSLSEKRSRLEIRIEELEREISVVERRLKNSRRPERASRRVIEVMFESRCEQELGLTVSYVAPGAGWEPVYKVDVPREMDRIGFTLFADIRQETGEDWEAVTLSLSNAVPVRGVTLPELHTWHIGPPPVAKPSRPVSPMPVAAGVDMGSPGEMALDDMLLEEPVAEYTQAVQHTLPTAFEYELTTPVALASGDMDGTLLPLFTRELEGTFFTYAIPRVDHQPYLVCSAACDSEMLAGQMNIYFGGRFVGSTRLGEKKAGEEFLINLGVDRGLAVRREQTTDKQVETFFGKVERSHVAREKHYVVTLENLRDTELSVRLLDSIPVSGTDRIQVKGVEIEPAPVEKDFQKREGVMQWRFDLPPGGTREIRIKFFIKHPKGLVPYGL